MSIEFVWPEECTSFGSWVFHYDWSLRLHLGSPNLAVRENALRLCGFEFYWSSVRCA